MGEYKYCEYCGDYTVRNGEVIEHDADACRSRIVRQKTEAEARATAYQRVNEKLLEQMAEIVKHSTEMLAPAAAVKLRATVEG